MERPHVGDGEREPRYTGMESRALSPEVLRDLLGIYFAVGMSDDYERRHLDEDVEMVLGHLSEDRGFSNALGEFRFGSRFTMHTKFWIWNEFDGLIRFSLDPNMDREDLERPEVQAMVEVFDRRVTAYLDEAGLARPIYR